GESVLWGSPSSRTQKPQARCHGETRSSGVVPRRLPSSNEECVLMHPLQGASFLSTPLQGGILKPPALRVVGDFTPFSRPVPPSATTCSSLSHFSITWHQLAPLRSGPRWPANHARLTGSTAINIGSR